MKWRHPKKPKGNPMYGFERITELGPPIEVGIEQMPPSILLQVSKDLFKTSQLLLAERVGLERWNAETEEGFTRFLSMFDVVIELTQQLEART